MSADDDIRTRVAKRSPQNFQAVCDLVISGLGDVSQLWREGFQRLADDPWQCDNLRSGRQRAHCIEKIAIEFRDSTMAAKGVTGEDQDRSSMFKRARGRYFL